MIKVLVVDDSSFMRVKIRTLLESDPNIKVIGIARNGIEALDKVLTLKPDVITMDINMPDMSGITAVELIMKECPTPILMVSSLTYDGAKETVIALEKGAIDYIHKDQLTSELLVEKIYLAQNAVIKHPTQRSIEPTHVSGVRKAFSVIGIGISTGGPKALAKFMPEISSDIKASIVIAQHMPPIFTNSLAERLNAISKITVKEAKNGEPMHPGCAYICPGGMHMMIEKTGIISLYPRDVFPQYRFCPSADALMSSLSKTYGPKALCIIMTGMGSDGLIGIKEAKEHGSYIIAQSQDSSTIYGMPKAVIANNLQDEIVHLDHMGERINQLCIEN